MKRREFLKTAGAGIAATAIAAPAIAQSMPEVKWRLTSSWPKSLDTLYGGVETFAKFVAEATDNKFQIQTFAAGEIVPALQVMDAVSNGTVEMCHTATYYYLGKDPTFALFCAAPVRPQWPPAERLVRTTATASKLMNEFTKKYNIINLAGGNTGTQMGGWFRKEINSVSDLNGLKMRMGGFAGRVLQKLGTVPQSYRRRRHLSGAGEGHDRRRRVGRSVRRREARLLQGGEVLLLPGLVGGRHRLALHDQLRQAWEQTAEELPGHRHRRRRIRQRRRAGADTTRAIRPP